MIYYTWIDGRFFIKPKDSIQWQHLSNFHRLHQMDISLNNRRVTELAETGLPATGLSEGWALHQLWLNDPNYQLIKSH